MSISVPKHFQKKFEKKLKMISSSVEFWRSPTIFTFQIVFLHTTTNNYNLHYLHQRDESIPVKTLRSRPFLKWKTYNVLDFEWIFYNVSDSDVKKLKRV